jgi:hypothetical protein
MGPWRSSRGVAPGLSRAVRPGDLPLAKPALNRCRIAAEADRRGA